MELTASFREHNPDLRCRLFCRDEAEELISAHFTEREVDAFRACAVPAMQADYFRYCAALALGGACVDADFRCVRSLRGLIDTTASGVLFRSLFGPGVINGFFFFKEPSHPFLRLALEVVTVRVEQRAEESVWSITGPFVFSCLEAFHRLGNIDAVRREAIELDASADPLQVLELADSHRPMAEIFSGIRVMPFTVAKTWIGPPGIPLPYKKGGEHWVRWQSRKTIFSDTDRP